MYDQFILNNGFEISLMMSMRENWLLVGCAYAKIGYMLAEHVQKLVNQFSEHAQILVTCWLTRRANWLLAG